MVPAGDPCRLGVCSSLFVASLCFRCVVSFNGLSALGKSLFIIENLAAFPCPNPFGVVEIPPDLLMDPELTP